MRQLKLLIPSMSHSFEGVLFPASLACLHLEVATWDASSLTLPDSLLVLHLASADATPNMARLNLPDKLQEFKYDNANMDEPLDGWRLPASLLRLHLNLPALMQPVSALSLPPSLERLALFLSSPSTRLEDVALPPLLSDLQLLGHVSIMPAALFARFVHVKRLLLLAADAWGAQAAPLLAQMRLPPLLERLELGGYVTSLVALLPNLPRSLERLTLRSE